MEHLRRWLKTSPQDVHRIPVVTVSRIGSFTGFTENQLLSIEGASYRSCLLRAW
jgi:hypothetical protein